MLQQTEAKKKLHPFLTPIGVMIEKVSTEPPLEMVYQGIVEGSIAIVFGTPKSGKSTWAENLLISIAAGMDNYLGQDLKFKNKTALFLSFEENYRFRTPRNKKQLQKLTPEQLTAVRENYIVVNEGMPQYISTDQEWQMLADVIKSAEPGVVVLDSLTRLYQGSIEESSVAKKLTEKLRWLSNETKTTIIVIHHTHKIGASPLSMDAMAGSRVLSQEVETMIGINRTFDGKHYVKEVLSRYARCVSDTVKTFTIGDDGWLTVTGEADEMRLVAALDGRRDDANAERIYQFLLEQSAAGHVPTPFSDIESALVDTGVMSKQAAHTNLGKLHDAKRIEKPSKGMYKVAA